MKRNKAYGLVAVCLLSIPGVGPLTTLALLSSVGDINRFRDFKKLRAYWGTCGRLHQSGNQSRIGSITKRGNKTVRWLLSQALRSLHRKDPRARNRYKRLTKKKPRGVARSAQVNWLVGILYQVWKNEENYRLPLGAKK